MAVAGIYYVEKVLLLQKRDDFHEEGKLLLTYTSHGHVFLTVCCSDELQREEYLSPLNSLLIGGNMNWFSIIIFLITLASHADALRLVTRSSA